MTDDELVDALGAIFATDAVAGGLDRSDGYGDEYRIGSLQVVPGGDGFDDLLVTVDVGGRTVTARLLFDRGWREASGLDDAAAYATFVLARWRSSLVDDSTDVEPSVPLPGHAPVPEIESALRRTYGNANLVRRGVVEVVEEDGEIFLLHATPQDWRRFVSERPDAMTALEEVVGARWDDEDHIVFFRGAFHSSIRPETPPVRSMLLRDAAADDGDR